MKPLTLNVAIATFSLVMIFTRCGETDHTAERYHLDKTYWDVTDYENAIYYINATPSDQKKPNYADPITAPVIRKLTDIENVKVVAEDDVLGISHKADFTSQLFLKYQEAEDAYEIQDRQDKYVYPQELVDVLKFGLYLQINYFDLGNQQILKNADNPNAASTQAVIYGNGQTVIRNFCVYLDFIKMEKSFSDDALKSYAEGISTYFPMLIEHFPKNDFSELKSKINDMLKKTASSDVTNALNSVLSAIDANAAKQAEPSKQDSINADTVQAK